MRKGFTLLELMIVIIIVGVLATLAISQYSVLVEKSRAAEAKQVIGRIRGACAAIYMENGSTVGCDNAALKIGVPATAGIEIPGVAAANCASSNWFWYSAAVVGTTGVTVTATRCL
ncbi:MAG: prepilin-type N-terminal cleavage/methylation domain-containing protein, partial [Candidatus Omnitrophota bacterium]